MLIIWTLKPHFYVSAQSGDSPFLPLVMIPFWRVLHVFYSGKRDKEIEAQRGRYDMGNIAKERFSENTTPWLFLKHYEFNQILTLLSLCARINDSQRFWWSFVSSGRTLTEKWIIRTTATGKLSQKIFYSNSHFSLGNNLPICLTFFRQVLKFFATTPACVNLSSSTCCWEFLNKQVAWTV